MANQPDQSLQQLAERLRRVLSQQERQTVMNREQQLWLLRRAISESVWLRAVLEHPDCQRSIREAAAPVPSETHEGVTADLAKSIRPGHVLNVSYFKFPHKVVVETCSYSAADNKLAVRAIHYGRLRLLEYVTVLREDFSILCDGSQAWLHTFPNSVLYSDEETLSRAISRLGENWHNPMSNNAHSLALWCRVRDNSRHLDGIPVSAVCENGSQMHRIVPADHVELKLFNRSIHTVVSEVKPLDADDQRLIVAGVAAASDVANLRAFTRVLFTVDNSDDSSLERLQVPFQMAEIRKGVQNLTGATLPWECSDLEAVTFLATGVRVEPKNYQRTRLRASHLIPGFVIIRQDRVQIVLASKPPEHPGSSYRVETLQYIPLVLDPDQRTGELRVLVDRAMRNQLRLVRHSEPDIQCPILRQWKQFDTPKVEELRVADITQLELGDAVCIREKSDSHPFESNVPGLHAIVKSVNQSTEESDFSLDVICFNGEDSMHVESLRIPAKGHAFNILRFRASPELLSSKQVTLQKALARVGTGGYSSAWNNSRDLVRWCCVNHRSNAPNHLGPVTGIGQLLALPALGQGWLSLQQEVAGSAILRQQEARLVAVSLCDECVDLAKLSLTEVTWQPKTVQLLTVPNLKACRVSRINYGSGQRVDESMAQALTDTTAILLGTSLADASDRRLGDGVTAQRLCNWLRGLRRPGLVELAILLSPSSRSFANLLTELPTEEVADLDKLSAWDHIIVERPQCEPIHMLFIDANSERSSLRGYTYATSVEHNPKQRVEAYAFFPPEKSPYPIQKAIRRTPDGGDASSQLSASLAAASRSPDDAAAWAQLCVRELECDLLMRTGQLSELLKSMLKFALRAAAGEFEPEGPTREACIRALASGDFAHLVESAVAVMTEDKTRRLWFLLKLVSTLLGRTP